MVSIPDLCLLSYFTLILPQLLLEGVISCGIHGIYTCTSTRFLALTVYLEALAFDLRKLNLMNSSVIQQATAFAQDVETVKFHQSNF